MSKSQKIITSTRLFLAAHKRIVKAISGDPTRRYLQRFRVFVIKEKLFVEASNGHMLFRCFVADAFHQDDFSENYPASAIGAVSDGPTISFAKDGISSPNVTLTDHPENPQEKSYPPTDALFTDGWDIECTLSRKAALASIAQWPKAKYDTVPLRFMMDGTVRLGACDATEEHWWRISHFCRQYLLDALAAPKKNPDTIVAKGKRGRTIEPVLLSEEDGVFQAILMPTRVELAVFLLK